MKSMSRKALRLASEYSNRQYKVSREIANELGIVHKPRWRQFYYKSKVPQVHVRTVRTNWN